MSHIRVDKNKALKKWGPVLENMGVHGERTEWMAEYAELHSMNENAYVNATTAGMGQIVAPQPGSLSGLLGGGPGFGSQGVPSGAFQVGSGDVAQNLLPVAMKIAAQTIGLDLVAVKPSPGPRIELMYVDFQYDDLNMEGGLARPQVFKVTSVGTASFATVKANLAAQVTSPAVLTIGGIQGTQVFTNINSGAFLTKAAVDAGSKQNVVEFLGFSRIDGAPMFRAYRQANSTVPGTSMYPYAFGQTLNTFSPTPSMAEQIVNLAGVTMSTDPSIELVSALEDQLPGFSSNWKGGEGLGSGEYPMDREEDDNSYPGVMGPKVKTKSVKIGSIEVSAALRRTDIEDIKANTGMDIVQKMESVLVNELSQTISRQIVARIFELGNKNRESAPAAQGALTNISDQKLFDFDTDYVVGAGGIGGETTHAVQRKLITKMLNASFYISTEGRVGPAQFAVTNGALAAAIMDIVGYTINPVKSKLNGSGQLYPIGQVGEMQVYVDPNMRYDDNRIVLGRKNNPDQPGLIFIPYLMAQSVSIISEATFAPRMLLRSRYAIADVGFFPEKQYMTIKVSDKKGFLN
jgi:hypothetical protein